MNILMVEDDIAEAEFAPEALEDAGDDVCVEVVGDGVEALAFVRHEDRYASTYDPDLILLDLNLPRLDGHSVLRELKLDPKLRRIPVIVFSNSEASEDIEQVYRLNGNCYVTKPDNLGGMFDFAHSLISFWRTARLPKNPMPQWKPPSP